MSIYPLIIILYIIFSKNIDWKTYPMEKRWTIHDFPLYKNIKH